MYQRGLADRASARFPVCVSPPVSLHPLPNLNTVIIPVSEPHNIFRDAYVRQTQICGGHKQDSGSMAV